MGHCLFMRKGETHTAPISGILASNLAVGSSVYLMEDGVATEYLVVNQGKPSGSSLYDDSCDGTRLLRKDIKQKMYWYSSNVNSYADSDIHPWLNGDFFNLFGAIEQDTIKQVKIPYHKNVGNSGAIMTGANGLSCKAFLLSAYELGWTTSDYSWFSYEGAKLEFFDSGTDATANTKRVAYLNGSIEYQWTRTPTTANATNAFIVMMDGSYGTNQCASGNNGIRPALILPSTAVFDKTTMLLKGVA